MGREIKPFEFMEILRSVAEFQQLRPNLPEPLVFVPTMGALHDGHRALIRMARENAGESGSVVVSIFVNPLQFGPGEDLDKYPRTEERDLRFCREDGADAVLLPTPEDMYPADRSVVITETRLSRLWEGATRPGHFDGVCTVVLKLFNLVHPQSAVFGRKDYQQLAIIRRMARDLNVPTEVLSAPTVREEDGLAMSSRNRYLDEEQRRQALALRKAILRGVELVRARGEVPPDDLSDAMQAVLEDYPLVELDYLVGADAETLEPLEVVTTGDIILGALYVGNTRLIDNEIIHD
jgi:pantoate--beta-alanine ligase